MSAIKEAAEDAKRSGVDVFISVGGGSPIDSVKGNITVSMEDSWRSCVDGSYYSFFTDGTWGGISTPHRYSNDSLRRR